MKGRHPGFGNKMDLGEKGGIDLEAGIVRMMLSLMGVWGRIPLHRRCAVCKMIVTLDQGSWSRTLIREAPAGGDPWNLENQRIHKVGAVR
jgi:hypothetical protein